jgi:RNA polymerase sigma-70 factor, ECF subfamily
MRRDNTYEEVFTTFSGAIDRLARSYEIDSEKRRDLLQDIHFAVWRSLKNFDGQCSLRTWVYRVAHNVAASHVLKNHRANQRPLLSLDDIHDVPGAHDPAESTDRQMTLDRLYSLIQQLDAVDRQVILLYLEDLDAGSIADVVGITAVNAATKIHRIKKILTRKFTEGGRRDA